MSKEAAKRAGSSERAEMLARLMRENLKKRKAQARARTAARDADDEPAGTCPSTPPLGSTGNEC